MLTIEVSSELRVRFEHALRQPIARMETIHRGYTPALRLRCHLRDGSTVFIKCATTGPTADWLRSEYAVYSPLDAPFLACLMAWDGGESGEGSFPFLVLEDLSAGCWPPPWTTHQIDQVLQVLDSPGARRARGAVTAVALRPALGHPRAWAAPFGWREADRCITVEHRNRDS